MDVGTLRTIPAVTTSRKLRCVDGGTLVGTRHGKQGPPPDLGDQSLHWWWRYAVYVDHLKPEAGYPVHERSGAGPF